MNATPSGGACMHRGACPGSVCSKSDVPKWRHGSRRVADRRIHGVQEAEQMKPYLSVCSIYRDHAEYLREWIEFHRLVGVERFFLYDNESSDDHREVLAPCVERGIVVIHDWPN